MRETRRGLTKRSWLALLAWSTIALAWGLSLNGRANPSPFVDEATYIVAGRALLAQWSGGLVAPPFARYFSGAPILYPPLAALCDSVGGLQGARALSLVCIVIASFAIGRATRRLFDDRAAGVAAAAVFLVSAPTIFVATLATYDAMSLMLLSLALASGASLSRPRRTLLAMIACGAALGAAIMVKYAALLYAPFVVAVALFHDVPSNARATRVQRLGMIVVATLLSLAAVGAISGPAEILTGFRTTTLARSTTSGSSAADVIAFAMRLGGVPLLLALPTLAVPRPASRWCAAALFVAGVAAPLNHARIHESVSLHKHVAFGTLMVAPLAGRTLARLARWIVDAWRHDNALTASATGLLVALLLVVAAALPAARDAGMLWQYWPAVTARAYAPLRPLARPKARFLSEEPDIGAYYLPTTTLSQWSTPYVLDGATAPSGAPPTAAYTRAVADGRFDAIVLRFGTSTHAWARAIDSTLRAGGAPYRSAQSILYSLADGPGVYDVWVRDSTQMLGVPESR